MIEATISGLVVALLCAIAWLAYNHPQPYKTVSTILSAIGLAVLVGLNAWDLAIYQMMTAVSKVDSAHSDMINRAATRQLIDMGWILLGATAWLVYLAVLSVWVTKLKQELQREHDSEHAEEAK